MIPETSSGMNWKQTVDLLNILLRLYRLLWQVSPFHLLGNLFFRVLLALHPVVQLYITTALVNRVALVITEGHSIVGALNIILLQAGLFIASSGVRALDGMIMASMKTKTRFHIEEKMAVHSSRLPLVHFDRPDFHDSFHRAMASQNSLFLIDNSFAIIQSLLTFSGYFAVVAGFHWILAVGLLLFVTPSLIVNFRLGRQRFLQMVMQTPVARKAQYVFYLLTGRDAAKEVRLFDLSNYLLGAWRSLFWKNANEQLRLERKGLAMNWGVDAFGTLVGGALLTGLAWLGTKGRLTIGQYVALTEAFSSANNQLMIIANNLAIIHQNILFARELFAFFELPEEEQSAEQRRMPERITRGIEVRDLSFCYPNRAEPSIRDINLHIAPGQKIAIVGDNGAGKSTLAKCMLGLYTPTTGSVCIDGADIRNLERSDLRRKITAVFQDYVRYQMTVRENIGFGSLERMHDDAWLEVAAAKSGADEFIDRMPQRFDALLGPMFEGGRELSHGQWQKIAIGRAYFRDAEIVVLDEPTASMDPLTEAMVFENFLRMAEGKTAIIISHRLGICKAVDRIYVMKNGRIIEQGTHEELLGQNGEYRHMYETQSKWYDRHGLLE